MRLLVLDDDLATTEFLAAVARRYGWDVVTATRPDAFRELVRSAAPDAILLDLQLGATDGIEELRFLHGCDYAGAIILASGFDERVLASARRVGESLGLTIAATIQKPMREARIREALMSIQQAPADGAPSVIEEERAQPAAIEPAELANAINAGRMELHLQPIVAAVGHGVRRAEALIRWRDPVRGLVRPDAFIPVAESDARVIDQLTMWVAETGASHHQQLARRGLPVQVCINISGCNLRSFDFPDRLAALRQRLGLPDDALGLEITETVAMRDLDISTTVLTRLRIKGFQIAIDDFGTGHSSLAALRRLPFTAIKIDKSFVSDMLTSSDSLTIVRSVIQLARDLGLPSVAEGVESVEAAECLTELGVGNLQGYYFSEPLPFERFATWLGDWSRGDAVVPA